MIIIYKNMDLPDAFKKSAEKIFNTVNQQRSRSKHGAAKTMRGVIAGSLPYLLAMLQHADENENARGGHAETIKQWLAETRIDCDMRIEQTGEVNLNAFKKVYAEYIGTDVVKREPEKAQLGIYYPAVLADDFPDGLDCSFHAVKTPPRSNFDAYIAEDGDLFCHTKQHAADFKKFLNDGVIISYNLPAMMAVRFIHQSGQYEPCDVRAASRFAHLIKSYLKPLSLGKKFDYETAMQLREFFNKDKYACTRKAAKTEFVRKYKQLDYEASMKVIRSEVKISIISQMTCEVRRSMGIVTAKYSDIKDIYQKLRALCKSHEALLTENDYSPRADEQLFTDYDDEYTALVGKISNLSEANEAKINDWKKIQHEVDALRKKTNSIIGTTTAEITRIHTIIDQHRKANAALSEKKQPSRSKNKSKKSAVRPDNKNTGASHLITDDQFDVILAEFNELNESAQSKLAVIERIKVDSANTHAASHIEGTLSKAQQVLAQLYMFLIMILNKELPDTLDGIESTLTDYLQKLDNSTVAELSEKAKAFTVFVKDGVDQKLLRTILDCHTLIGNLVTKLAAGGERVPDHQLEASIKKAFPDGIDFQQMQHVYSAWHQFSLSPDVSESLSIPKSINEKLTKALTSLAQKQAIAHSKRDQAMAGMIVSANYKTIVDTVHANIAQIHSIPLYEAPRLFVTVLLKQFSHVDAAVLKFAYASCEPMIIERMILESRADVVSRPALPAADIYSIVETFNMPHVQLLRQSDYLFAYHLFALMHYLQTSPAPSVKNMHDCLIWQRGFVQKIYYTYCDFVSPAEQVLQYIDALTTAYSAKREGIFSVVGNSLAALLQLKKQLEEIIVKTANQDLLYDILAEHQDEARKHAMGDMDADDIYYSNIESPFMPKILEMLLKVNPSGIDYKHMGLYLVLTKMSLARNQVYHDDELAQIENMLLAVFDASLVTKLDASKQPDHFIAHVDEEYINACFEPFRGLIAQIKATKGAVSSERMYKDYAKFIFSSVLLQALPANTLLRAISLAFKKFELSMSDLLACDNTQMPAKVKRTVTQLIKYFNEHSIPTLEAHRVINGKAAVPKAIVATYVAKLFSYEATSVVYKLIDKVKTTEQFYNLVLMFAKIQAQDVLATAPANKPESRSNLDFNSNDERQRFFVALVAYLEHDEGKPDVIALYNAHQQMLQVCNASTSAHIAHSQGNPASSAGDGQSSAPSKQSSAKKKFK